MFTNMMMLQMILAVFGHEETCVCPQGAKLPDMVTVVPQQIGLTHQQQTEWIRFTNNIVNIGEGPWWMESDLDVDSDTSEHPAAYQVFYGGSTNVPHDAVPPAFNVEGYLDRCEIGEFDFHPEHNHWHIAQVADYRVCSEAAFLEAYEGGTPGECVPPIHVEPADKVTFCLIDWTKIGDKTATSDDTRTFWDCYTSFQGISPGWGDQYHHSLADQGINITEAPSGTYYLVSTVNPDGIFFEGDYSNNSAWVKFELSPEGKGQGDDDGNRKVTVLEGACDGPANQKHPNDPTFRDRLEADVADYIDWSETDIPSEDFIDQICNGVVANK